MNYKKSNKLDIILKREGKIKTVFYARVSTDEYEQLHSLNQQIDYFKKYINENPEWEYSGMYIDEGITGTNIKKRIQFQNMIKDAENGKFNLILTKEVSRFARNSVDTLNYSRKLSNLNVYIMFTIDGIYTYDDDYELRLSMMAAIAQEESRKISQRVKWGHEKSMSRGVVFGNNNIFGYDIVDKKLVKNNESTIVRKIFDMYLYERVGTTTIIKYLKHNNINKKSSTKWTHTDLTRILRNEKYCGRLIQKKSLTTDYLDKIRILNDGRENQIIIENNHEAIITPEEFDQVQDLLKNRAEKHNMIGIEYSTRHPLSSKLICAQCGEKYQKVSWNKLKSGRSYAFKCRNAVAFGKKKSDNDNIGCNNIGLSLRYIESALLEMFEDITNLINTHNEFCLSIIKENEKNIDHEEITKIKLRIFSNEKRIEKLLDMCLNGKVNEGLYEKKNKELEHIINKDKELLNKLNKTSTLPDINIDDLKKYKFDKIDDIYMCHLIKNIIADKKTLKVELFGGLILKYIDNKPQIDISSMYGCELNRLFIFAKNKEKRVT